MPDTRATVGPNREPSFLDKLRAEFPTNLSEWQASQWVHPYTCPNRSTDAHQGTDAYDRLTVVSETELRCVVCGHEQTVGVGFPDNIITAT